MGAPAKITTASLRRSKEAGEKIVALTCYDHLLANLLDEAGVDVLLVGDSVAMTVQGHETTVPVTMDEMVYHTRLVSRTPRRGLVVADMPFLSYQVSEAEALTNAGRLLKEGGAEAVKLEGGQSVVATVRLIVEAGIPVMGHLGLTPQSIHQFGTYRTRGTEPSEAEEILHDAQRLEAAGVFALVLEKIPRELAARVTAALSVPTIGIGAGPECDGQVLVTHDLLGLFTRFRPRFVRRYAELAQAIQAAVQRYAEDVRSGEFPGVEESY